MATRRYYDECGDEIAPPARRPEPRRSPIGALAFNWLVLALALLFAAMMVGTAANGAGMTVPFLSPFAAAITAGLNPPQTEQRVCTWNGAPIDCAAFDRLNNEAATAAARNPAAPAVAAPTPPVELRVIGPDGARPIDPAAPVEQPAPVVLAPAILDPPAAPVEAAPAPAPALPQLAQDFVEAVQPPVEQAAPPPVGASVCYVTATGACPVPAPQPAPQPESTPAAPVASVAPQVGAQAFLDAVAGPTPTPRVCLAYRDGVCPAGGGK